MREIGSEFWLDNIPTESDIKLPNWLTFGEDQCFLLSGRRAIDYVLEDLSKETKRVYMPSYCCQSMLQPFLDRNIKIDFYEVMFDDEGVKYIIDYEKPCDVFFAISYFGFSDTVMDSIIEMFNIKGVIVIEDITHRLLCGISHCNKADYNIASLRKWFAIPSGGLAVKLKGSFSEKLPSTPSAFLIDMKVKAMLQKSDYINKYEKDIIITDINKKDFLRMFSEFNKELQIYYKSMKIDLISKKLISIIDVELVKEKRRDNASYLYQELKNNYFVKPLLDEPNFTHDCPLFFPIKVNSTLRESLRKYLADNEIYCPIHWPKPNESHLNDITNVIFDEELSLICDQRYGIDDMKRIVRTIEEFWN